MTIHQGLFCWCHWNWIFWVWLRWGSVDPWSSLWSTELSAILGLEQDQTSSSGSVCSQGLLLQLPSGSWRGVTWVMLLSRWGRDGGSWFWLFSWKLEVLLKLGFLEYGSLLRSTISTQSAVRSRRWELALNEDFGGLSNKSTFVCLLKHCFWDATSVLERETLCGSDCCLTLLGCQVLGALELDQLGLKHCF